MGRAERDPERLLSEALRAQANQTHEPPAQRASYGLLSGADANTIAEVRAEVGVPEPVAPTRAVPTPERTAPRRASGGGWLLLGALLLGLAAGAAVALATLL
ncbi:hypothetical protein EV191_103159 [Tamaricihabitans halophyticus]|uniref:Uncharacterized protein n=1 Tax=Tamaricihabitans halophyticus TaxID=1262583 RepID=A0A4R2QYJ5_9PSEU|nr:hypothetical protein [Tamaricihabitans halophyticus]TCP54118.1 hypothetical protein EV191_103159 [Tamaricihabitans halophyticus]